MDENIYLVRQYFENYVYKHDIEIDTNICDMLVGIMYEECISYEEPLASEERLNRGKAILQSAYDDLGNR